jgi:1-acyl-sn-glycerol-3-phosphate acyltransferase
MRESSRDRRGAHDGSGYARPHFVRGIDKWVGTDPGLRVANAIIDYFPATIAGLEHVPREGGALLVGNHGTFGLDAFILGAFLSRELGRLPTWLAERHLWHVPLMPRALAWVRAIEGEPQAAIRHLERGELVVVYPGGIHDSYKGWRERHRLQWGARAGFARVAMRARVPIVPVAACGIDDAYRVLAREPGLGKLLFGDDRYNFPIALGRRGTLLPKKVPVSFHVLPPIEALGDVESADDVERVRRATHDALTQLLAAH